MSANLLSESTPVVSRPQLTSLSTSVLPPVQNISKSPRLCAEGWLSFCCYVGTLTVVIVSSICQYYIDIVPHYWKAIFWGPVLYYVVVNVIVRCLFKKNDYQIAVRASFLGFATACGILLIILAPGVWKQLGVYWVFMAFFHYSEFLTIAWCNPASLSVDSFILNHSWIYAIAAFSSWVEFFLEVYCLPPFKEWNYLWLSGVVLCTFGEAVRKTAMITANSSFTHMVQQEKGENQKLITHGVYAYVRHPAYVGWFWWSIGTQIVLMNPACIVFYAVVSWKFFHNRIYSEEYTLLNFFQRDYETYQKKVPTGLPFIHGFYTK